MLNLITLMFTGDPRLALPLLPPPAVFLLIHLPQVSHTHQHLMKHFIVPNALL